MRWCLIPVATWKQRSPLNYHHHPDRRETFWILSKIIYRVPGRTCSADCLQSPRSFEFCLLGSCQGFYFESNFSCLDWLNTSVRNKILKNPNKHQQTKTILNIPITVSACNVKSKSVQSKKSSFHLLTPKLNRRLAATAILGVQTSPCSSSLALSILS